MDIAQNFQYLTSFHDSSAGYAASTISHGTPITYGSTSYETSHNPIDYHTYSYQLCETLPNQTDIPSGNEPVKENKKRPGEKPYKCTICNYSCSQSYSLKEHMRKHSGEKPYACAKCEMKFTQKTHLNRHVKNIHLKEKPFTCSECDYAAAQKCELKTHIQRKHTPKDPTQPNKAFLCQDCDYVASGNKDLKLHMMTHTGVKPFKCTECEYITPRESTLKLHMMTHTGTKPHVCKICDYSAIRKRELVLHEMSHQGIKPFSCSECDYSATRKADLKLHAMSHSGEKPFACLQCASTFKRKRELLSHMTIHTGTKPYACHLCNYTTTRKELLNSHMNVHTGRKKYSCSFCDFTNARKDNVKRHMLKHTIEKTIKPTLSNTTVLARLSENDARFNSDPSQKSYSLVQNLHQENSHEKEFQIVCRYCEYKCIKEEYLHSHIKIKHPREYPYSCDICDFMFQTQKDLKDHSVIHEKEQYSTGGCRLVVPDETIINKQQSSHIAYTTNNNRTNTLTTNQNLDSIYISHPQRSNNLIDKQHDTLSVINMSHTVSTSVLSIPENQPKNTQNIVSEDHYIQATFPSAAQPFSLSEIYFPSNLPDSHGSGMKNLSLDDLVTSHEHDTTLSQNSRENPQNILAHSYNKSKDSVVG